MEKEAHGRTARNEHADPILRCHNIKKPFLHVPERMHFSCKNTEKDFWRNTRKTAVMSCYDANCHTVFSLFFFFLFFFCVCVFFRTDTPEKKEKKKKVLDQTLRSDHGAVNPRYNDSICSQRCCH